MRYRLLKKFLRNSVFFKNEGHDNGGGQKYFNCGSVWRMRIFRSYIAKAMPLTFDGQMQKTGISVTFGRFGAFPDLWRHTYREFLSVSLDLAYRPDETFCSRTHRFGWETKYRACWKGRNVHRRGDYYAAHFEFCRRRRTPSGPPSALTSRIV